MTPTVTVIQGDALEQLKALPDRSVHMIVSSPPYWGLRSYLPKDHPLKRFEIGTEKTPEEFVAKLVAVFREGRRVLRDDGTLWVNMGDSYSGSGNGGNQGYSPHIKRKTNSGSLSVRSVKRDAFKPKDLVGVPWMLAFALRADGWYLRQDIIWSKPSCMPESVTDRCTKSHEYIFLLSKSAQYFYDAEAIKERASVTTLRRAEQGTWLNLEEGPTKGFPGQADRNRAQMNRELRDKLLNGETIMANKRSVWTVNSAGYMEAHFATFPPELIKPCILAGTSAKGACADCGAPWERIIESQPMVIDRSDRIPFDGHSTRSSGHMVSPPKSETLGWQPTCECHGKLVRKTVMLPPRISGEAAGQWGADSNGEYNGESQKDHPEGIQDASALKKRIIDNATRPRQVTRIVYESDLPLDQHKTIPCAVLDPFGGSGTVGQVSLENGRSAVLIELNPEYLPLIADRTNVTPSLAL